MKVKPVILILLAFLVVGLFLSFVFKNSSAFSSSNGAMTIEKSGATNSPGWILTVYADGSADAKIMTRSNETTKHFPKDTFSKVVELTQSVGDVSKMHVADCPKSASLGTSVTITYNGKESKDISCLFEDAPEKEQKLFAEIEKDTQTVAN
jgi:hypothetical protein